MGCFQACHQFTHAVDKPVADLVGRRRVPAIIHAVTEGYDGRLKCQHIAVQPLHPARCRVSTPAGIEKGQVQLRITCRQIGFDVIGVKLLFGDGVA